jgi:prepilin-type N-terminal cleavage/methylation domain-containing protein
MMHRTFNHLRVARRGFSFIEVMFAVIILGIGFVMVSAMFPVAIQQTQMNVEDAAVGRVSLSAQQNFTALKQDLVAQAHNNTIKTNYPNGVINDLYYGWPISLPAVTSPPPGQTYFPGRVFGFRDPRAYTYPVLPTPYPTPAPNLFTNQYHFPLNSTIVSGVGSVAITGLWERVRGNLISSAEPQYAYVPMFQRGGTFVTGNPAAPWAADSQFNIYVFIASARNRTPYSYTNPGTYSDLFRNPKSSVTSPPPLDTNADLTGEPATLEPRLVTVTIYPRNGAQLVDQIVIQASTAGWSDSYLAAGTGGFVIISDDTNGSIAPPWPAWSAGFYNGQVFRLGASTVLSSAYPAPPAASTTWELQPGYDVQNTAGFGPAGKPMQAFILGRAYANPDLKHTTSANPYDGPVQDLAVQQFSVSIPK